MQAIAMENNLSETAFFVQEKEDFHIRWFTPVAEVDLCGHATLASAFVIFTHIDQKSKTVTFSSKSGNLIVERKNDLLAMNFPSNKPQPCFAPKELLQGLKTTPLEVMRSKDYFVVFETERDVKNLIPDMNKLKKLDLRGIIVTAQGNQADFVSRFFAPQLGITEDPVTGSAHTSLVPYWAEKLKKDQLYAQQLSERGGELYCQNQGERVIISGHAVEYMRGEITI